MSATGSCAVLTASSRDWHICSMLIDGIRRMFRSRYCYTLVAVGALLPAMAGQTLAPTAAAIIPTQTTETLFRSVDDFWSQQIGALGGRYRSPKLSSFSQSMSGVCDVRITLTGAFYCPVNETVYLDEAFLRELVERSRDEGNAALGYVVAHELAHHIQNIIGTTGLVNQARSRSTPQLGNRILTTMELQADCYAGLWVRWAQAHGAIKLPADISKTLDTVAAIGQEWQLHVAVGQQVLDPFTHGSEAQRLKWFRRGSDTGQFGDCDTFGAQANGNL